MVTGYLGCPISPRARISPKYGAIDVDFEKSASSCLTSVRTFHTVRNILTSGSSMITSKLTSKAQTTIPQPIRAALKLREGDELVYEIRGQQVVLTKARQDSPADDPFQTFSEWNSAADRKAYGDL
jgi:antitoxin PrlF